MRSLLRALDRYWFAPASLRTLGLVRILLVGGQLGLFVAKAENRQIWLAGAEGVWFAPIPALKLLLLPLGWGARPSVALLETLAVAGFVAGVLALVGCWTRVSLFVLAYAQTVIIAHKYSYGDYHHSEAPLVILLWILALAPAGAAWSVDGLRRRLREAKARMAFVPAPPESYLSPFARWPLLLGAWLLVLIYFSAALLKVQVGGAAWFNGTTLTYYLARDALLNDLPLGLWISRHEWVAQLLSVTTFAFELTFAVAVLVPASAWLYVAVGTALHTGIYLAQRAPFFEFIVAYAVFLEPVRRTVRRAVRGAVRRWWPGRAPGRWTVIYDGLCPLCIRSMTTLDYLDGGHRLAYVDLERAWAEAEALAPGITPERARERMHVVAPDGRVLQGFYAFRELARALPALRIAHPVLRLAPVERLGTRIYDRVAATRSRTLCRVDSCAL